MNRFVITRSSGPSLCTGLTCSQSLFEFTGPSKQGLSFLKAKAKKKKTYFVS